LQFAESVTFRLRREPQLSAWLPAAHLDNPRPSLLRQPEFVVVMLSSGLALRGKVISSGGFLRATSVGRVNSFSYPSCGV
jgi:hypothetical protein